MAVQNQGNSGIISEVDSTFRALRNVAKPLEHSTFGQYRVSAVVGLVATQAANGTLFSFRWGDATRFCVVESIRLQCLQTVAATATIWPYFEVFLARGFTASDSVGTAVTMTGNNQKMRTNMGTSLVTDMRFSAAAAGLTVGTRTLDANPIMQLATTQIITTPNPAIAIIERLFDTGAQHPVVFTQNEGFIVRGPSTIFGAAGTANLHVEVAWAEVAAY